MPHRAVAALFCSVLLSGSLMAQGVWSAPFDHMPSGPQVHPASDSIAFPGRWITEAYYNAASQTVTTPTPGTRFNAIHTCLIPSGPFRGCLLVVDGNHRLVGTRFYQPWAIVNPYWPAPNPFVVGGGSGYRFHNATLQMPISGTLPEGELFCAGQRWTADGRLFLAGGTRVYPPAGPGFPPTIPANNTGMPDMWEGAKFVYQWDANTSTANPFGQWFRMADLDAERWYPTVSIDGSSADRLLILGGTDWNGMSTLMDSVNSYESYRILFGSLIPSVFSIEQKTVTPTPPPTARQYAGTTFTVLLPTGPTVVAQFSDYPRIHALGVLDPISGAQSAPRQFLSGWWGQGFRWAHDPATNPSFSLDVGQESVQSWVQYSTNVLMPGSIGQINTRVARIGGGRVTITGGGATERVETVVAGGGPAFWSSGTPNDVPDMLEQRLHANVVILPNGWLFAVGGIDAALTPRMDPEILPEGASAWRYGAPQSSPRDYHSCALLLPDARVFVCGADNRTSDYEIWEPNYLQVAANRRPAGVKALNATTTVPLSETMLGGAAYEQECIVTWTNVLAAGVEVSQVVLMAPAAVTHHDDGGQRIVRLLTYFDDDSTPPYTQAKFKLPASARHAPPGWYMLFALTNEGVPSMAYWINLR